MNLEVFENQTLNKVFKTWGKSLKLGVPHPIQATF